MGPPGLPPAARRAGSRSRERAGGRRPFRSERVRERLADPLATGPAVHERLAQVEARRAARSTGRSARAAAGRGRRGAASPRRPRAGRRGAPNRSAPRRGCRAPGARGGRRRPRCRTASGPRAAAAGRGSGSRRRPLRGRASRAAPTSPAVPARTRRDPAATSPGRGRGGETVLLGGVDDEDDRRVVAEDPVEAVVDLRCASRSRARAGPPPSAGRPPGCGSRRDVRALRRALRRVPVEVRVRVRVRRPTRRASAPSKSPASTLSTNAAHSSVRTRARLPDAGQLRGEHLVDLPARPPSPPTRAGRTRTPCRSRSRRSVAVRVPPARLVQERAAPRAGRTAAARRPDRRQASPAPTGPEMMRAEPL